jgi:hypothetical protein
MGLPLSTRFSRLGRVEKTLSGAALVYRARALKYRCESDEIEMYRSKPLAFNKLKTSAAIGFSGYNPEVRGTE